MSVNMRTDPRDSSMVDC